MTSVDGPTGSVVVQWNKPASNGADILSYTIEFNSVSGWQAAGSCNGLEDAQIVLTQTCTVSMSTFTDEFGLTLHDLIQVRVSATNSIGTGIWSVVNTLGARVRGIPGQMSSP